MNRTTTTIITSLFLIFFNMPTLASGNMSMEPQAEFKQFLRPKFLTSFVTEVKTSENILVLKKRGGKNTITITEKTKLLIQENDGDVRSAQLSDFTTGSRVVLLVRRDIQNAKKLIAVVAVQVPGPGYRVPGPGY